MEQKKDAMQLLMERLMDPTPRREGGLSNEELSLHAIGLAGQSHVSNMVGRLDYFCNTVLGIEPGLVGWFSAISRFWDGVNDPLVGAYIDRHRFAGGEKLRPFIKRSALPIGICGTLLFVDFGLRSQVLTMLLILLFYMVFDTFYSFSSISLWGMTALMSPRSEERAQIVQWSRIGSGIGGFLPGLITPVLGYRDKLPFSLSVLFFIFGLVFCFGGAMLTMVASHSKERVPHQASGLSLWQLIRVNRANTILILLALASLLSSFSLKLDGIYIYQQMNYTIMGQTVPGELALTMAGIFTGLPGSISIFFATKAAKKLGGMKQILLLSTFMSIVVRVCTYFIGYQSFGRLVLNSIVGLMADIPGSMTGIATTALWGDSLDYQEWKTGVRTEGIAFSLQNFISKMGGGISSFLHGQVLKRLLFDAKLAQTRQPQGALFQKYAWPIHTLGPVIGSVLYLIPILLIRYPEEKKQQVEAELAQRRAKTQGEDAGRCAGAGEREY